MAKKVFYSGFKYIRRHKYNYVYICKKCKDAIIFVDIKNPRTNNKLYCPICKLSLRKTRCPIKFFSRIELILAPAFKKMENIKNHIQQEIDHECIEQLKQMASICERIP